MRDEIDWELRDFCGQLNICAKPGCPNKSVEGTVFCTSCLHGVAERADTKAIGKKRRFEKQLAKTREAK